MSYRIRLELSGSEVFEVFVLRCPPRAGGHAGFLEGVLRLVSPRKLSHTRFGEVEASERAQEAIGHEHVDL